MFRCVSVSGWFRQCAQDVSNDLLGSRQMAVDMRKKTDVLSATRFYLNRQGANVPVITDIIERADSTVWIVSPLGGMGRSKMGYADTVAAFALIECGDVVKRETLV